MQLKITTDYAIRIVLYLSTQRGRVVSSKEIAQMMHIPRKYLIQIGADLREMGILSIHAGRYGGYSLVDVPEQITLYDIVNATEDTIKINRCMENDTYCNRFATSHCPMRRCYAVMQTVWEQFLRGITIADLIREPTQQEMWGKIIPLWQIQGV